MAELIITHRQRDYLLKMPYQVIINGRLVGAVYYTFIAVKTGEERIRQY